MGRRKLEFESHLPVQVGKIVYISKEGLNES